MYKIVILVLLISPFVNAEDHSEAIKGGVKNLAPTADVTSIEKTPIKGISEIVINTGRSGEIYYISNDGKYLMNGNMFYTSSREDLTENKKSGIRKELLSDFGDGERIDFFPEEMLHHVTVFTDIDCGYCRKLHNEIDEYNKLGIGISYLFFPRSGVNTPSFDKAITVWCSDNKQEAMTNAKSGVSLENIKCDNPIKVQYDAGLAAGVTGTPALITDKGVMMPGYLPPSQLLQRLAVLDSK